MTDCIEIPAATVAAYQATTYRADLPDGRAIALRIGVASPGLAALHSDYGVTRSVFVTAWNPFGEALPDADNHVAMVRLTAWLDSREIVWLPGAGVGDDGEWPPEPSLLALGLGEAEADALCMDFRQNAVVLCGEDATPRLWLHPNARATTPIVVNH